MFTLIDPNFPLSLIPSALCRVKPPHIEINAKNVLLMNVICCSAYPSIPGNLVSCYLQYLLCTWVNLCLLMFTGYEGRYTFMCFKTYEPLLHYIDTDIGIY